MNIGLCLTTPTWCVACLVLAWRWSHSPKVVNFVRIFSFYNWYNLYNTQWMMSNDVIIQMHHVRNLNYEMIDISWMFLFLVHDNTLRQYRRREHSANSVMLHMIKKYFVFTLKQFTYQLHVEYKLLNVFLLMYRACLLIRLCICILVPLFCPLPLHLRDQRTVTSSVPLLPCLFLPV